MTVHENKELPKGWGEDELTKFISFAQNNEIATLANMREYYSFLIDIDAAIYELCGYSLMQMNKHNPSVGYLLFVNSLNHFRASIRLATSGQCLPSYPVARAALEAAVYGWYLINDPSHEKLWHSKPKRDERDALRAWSKQFQFSNMIISITQLDAALADRLSNVYQSSIDYGAHPNEQSLYTNFEIIKNGGPVNYQMNLLHHSSNLFFYSLKFSMEVGLQIIELFRYTNTEEIQRLYNVRERLDVLIARYKSLRPSLMKSIEEHPAL